MERIIVSDNEVTRVEVGLLTEADIAHVASMAWQDTGTVPPGYFPAADPQASWLNEVTRAVMDGEIAGGLWLGQAGSRVQGPPSAAIIARRKPGFDGYTLIYATDPQVDRGGTALIDLAKQYAAQRGATIARAVYIPARVEYSPI